MTQYPKFFTICYRNGQKLLTKCSNAKDKRDLFKKLKEPHIAPRVKDVISHGRIRPC